MPANPPRLRQLRHRMSVLREAGLFIILAAEILVFAVLSPDFPTQSNLFNVARLVTENGIIALGMALVIASGGIDLSVGATFALSSVMLGVALGHGSSLTLAVAVSLAIALLCGLVNGLLVVALRLHPLLVTLGTLALFRGLALGVSNGNGFSNFPNSFEIYGQAYLFHVIPAQVVWWIAIAVVVYVVVTKTAAGRRLIAVGINEDAAVLTGIDVKRVRLAVYGASGLLAGLAGLIYSSRVFSVRGDSGNGLELLAIAAVVVGGASIRGGEISVTRTTLAVLVIGVISNGLVLAGIDTSWQYVTIGLVMVAAITVNELLTGRTFALSR